MAVVEVIPSAKRLMKSLRDIGYDFGQAVADIVDNSIEAGASVVSIDVEFDGDNSWIRIADNGRGMKPEELREAMRYGSEREYNEDDLGKFGLGLKTASLSQCQRLSVASRWNPARADIAAYTYDLKHIERTNRWEILSTERDEALGLIVRRPLGEGTGTVVVWQRLDRILGYKYPYGEMARKRLSQICREIEVHLGMVFHRFMMGEIKGKRIKLRLNGNEIKPWDPFCRNETKTRKLQPLSLRVEQEGGTSGSFRLEPYVLPHQDDFSSADAFRAASGPANWNQQQGFYVYRGGRMIQSGGWCGLRAPDEHMKLARIALSFSPKLDELFKINVAKMRVQLPPQSREAVREALLPSTKAARGAYDRRAAGPRHQSSPSGTASTSPSGSIGASASPTADTTKPAAPVMFTSKQWADRLLAKANKRERPVVEAVLNRL